MPTHTPGHSDPANWENPPVPESWYETIRETMPPYRPEVTPSWGVGAIPECFRSYPGVERSEHPTLSFAAWGTDARAVTEDHPLTPRLGADSPLEGVYDRDGSVLFLGTDHGTNTSLHLAEGRADLDTETRRYGTPMLVDGEREWVTFEDSPIDSDDFPECGAAFERERPDGFATETVGVADAKLVEQRPLVDFGVGWLETNR